MNRAFAGRLLLFIEGVAQDEEVRGRILRLHLDDQLEEVFPFGILAAVFALVAVTLLFRRDAPLFGRQWLALVIFFAMLMASH